MNTLFNQKRRSLLLGACLAVAAPSLFATTAKLKVPEELQGKTIKLIVGFPPGGGTDITARTLSYYLSELTGLSVIVENKPGAGGMIATEAVSRTKPDPTEWLCVTTGQLITNPLLMDISYDPLQELSLVARSSASPLVLVVRDESPYTSLADILEANKKNPGQLSYGSAGVGTPQHIGMEWLQSLSGLDAIHIPYRGSGPTMMALMSGEIDFVLESSTAAASHVRGGKVRAIGLSGGMESTEYPNVPSLADTYPEFNLAAWSGVALSNKLSDPVKEFAKESLQAALTNPEFIAKLREQGGSPNWMGADEFLQSVNDEYVITEKLVKERNIHL